MNTVTKNHWLIYAAATVIMALSCEMLFQSINQPKTSTPNPCPVDGDDIDDYAKGLHTCIRSTNGFNIYVCTYPCPAFMEVALCTYKQCLIVLADVSILINYIFYLNYQIDTLPAVVNAVRGSNMEVYLDGGVRKGTDVLKALAVGAKAVFIGRPVIWGPAYNVSMLHCVNTCEVETK